VGQTLLRLWHYLVGLLGQLLVRLWRSLVRFYRSLQPKTRRRLVVAAAITIALAPIWALNTAVSFFGNSIVFPLSPYFLRQKVSALATYFAHRPFCLLRAHPEIDPIIARASARQRLPKGLLAAVVHIESGGRPHRISWAGAMGPAQLMPDTARGLGVSDPFDTEAAVDGAARLLAEHLARFRRIRLALAAYHAGPGAIRGGRIPDNGETAGYVAKVMRVYKSLRPRRPPRAKPVPTAVGRVPGPLLVSGRW
jgi:soluble lytic murein transglycosylase-like protein